MWRMPWYDIVYLYKAYSDYVDEENKQQARIEADSEKYNTPDYGSYTKNITNDIANIKNAVSGSIPRV